MNTMTAVYNTWSIFYQTHVHLAQAKKNPTLTRELKKVWAAKILKIVNVDLEVIGTPAKSSSILFLGNHISYLDIPLLMASCDDVAFVAKSEVRSWPIIGKAAHLIGTVFVKREQKKSRHHAKLQIGDLLKNKKRIVMFPSGTTCISESKPWRTGAFEIAMQTETMIQPFRIVYSPLRQAAYIDDDNFLRHLFNLFKYKHIKAMIEFHHPVYITEIATDCTYWQQWSKGLIPTSGAPDAQV